MMNYIKEFWNRFFYKGNERSIKAKKNILLSFLIKGISIIIGFLFVPLLAKYLGTEEYGIWLTISSFAGWIGFFDIGLGNGLRNKLAEAFAAGNKELARKYISTSYVLVALFFISVLLIIYAISPFINWQSIFNTKAVANLLLLKISLFTITFFALRFIFQLISSVLFADQRPAFASSFNVLSNIISVVIIYLVTIFNSQGSLLTVSIILSTSPVFVLLVSSIIFFFTDYKDCSPKLKYVDFTFSKDLLGLGIKFFIFQIYGIILVTSTNFLITQLINPGEVPVYYAAYKYFSLTTLIFGIIITPLWSATTEAFVKEDFKWIKNVMSKLKKIALILSIFVLLMLLVSDLFYKYWLNGLITVPLQLSIILAIQSLIFLFFSPYISFLNGVGKLNLNLILIFFNVILYIPLAIFFTKSLTLGITGIVLAGIIAEIPLRITQPIQYRLIINKKAKGIWNR